MVDDHAVMVDPEERKEVARSLTTRREDLDKERKRLEDRGLRTDPVDEVLAIHRGDGATNGLVSKFAPQDNRDIFDDPEPVGDITVTGGKTGKRVLSKGSGTAELSADLFTGKLKADAVSGSKVVDIEGTVFEAGVLVVVTYTKNDMFLEQMKHWVRVVGGKAKPKVDGLEGRKGLEIALAIFESHEKGSAVKIPPPKRSRSRRPTRKSACAAGRW